MRIILGMLILLACNSCWSQEIERPSEFTSEVWIAVTGYIHKSYPEPIISVNEYPVPDAGCSPIERVEDIAPGNAEDLLKRLLAKRECGVIVRISRRNHLGFRVTLEQDGWRVEDLGMCHSCR